MKMRVAVLPNLVTIFGNGRDQVRIFLSVRSKDEERSSNIMRSKCLKDFWSRSWIGTIVKRKAHDMIVVLESSAICTTEHSQQEVRDRKIEKEQCEEQKPHPRQESHVSVLFHITFAFFCISSKDIRVYLQKDAR